MGQENAEENDAMLERTPFTLQSHNTQFMTQHNATLNTKFGICVLNFIA